MIHLSIILEPEGSSAIVHINIPESSRGKVVEGYITTKGREHLLFQG